MASKTAPRAKTTAKASAPAKATKPARKASKEAVVFTAPQLASHLKVDAKAFRKWLRSEDGGFGDGKYTRYAFPDNATTAKLVAKARAHFYPAK